LVRILLSQVACQLPTGLESNRSPNAAFNTLIGKSLICSEEQSYLKTAEISADKGKIVKSLAIIRQVISRRKAL
jgi:hypothetical protein